MKITLKSSAIILVAAVVSAFTLEKDKIAYRLFDAKGKAISYKNMLEKAAKADVILFGEYHNNPINHWLQYELTKDIYNLYNQKIILGAEMFEADNQQVLSDYVSGKIDEKEFKEKCRLWPNYTTDYKPLVEFAKKHQLPFIATNVPRKYASLLFKQGEEALLQISDEEKQWMAPLPFKYDSTLKCYKDMLTMMGEHANANMPKAQALKDATMSYFLLKNLNPGHTFIHYNGSYHSNNFESIYWYLKQERPDLKIVTIAAVEQDNLSKLEKENLNLADFIICTPESMTKTH
jgi:uncharacterized iron-regulated protein